MRGLCRGCVALGAERLRPLASRDTAAELIRVVPYPKFGLTADERRDLLDDYLPYCETVTLPDPPPVVPECRDPFDRPFLELALAGRADALITGDADILALAESFAVPILSPAALEMRLPGMGSAGAMLRTRYEKECRITLRESDLQGNDVGVGDVGRGGALRVAVADGGDFSLDDLPRLGLDG